MSYDFPQPRPRPRSGARSTERGRTAPAPLRAVPLPQGPRSAACLEALRELDTDHDISLGTCPDLRSAAAAIRAEFAGNPAEPAPAMIAKSRSTRV